MDGDLTLALGRFIAGLRHGDIPAQAMAPIRTAFADTLGVAIAGGYVRRLIPRNTTVPTSVTEELGKLQGDIDRRWIDLGLPAALVLSDRPTEPNPRVFRRGSPSQPGPEVPLATLEDPATEAVTGETYGGLKALCEQAGEPVAPVLAMNLREDPQPAIDRSEEFRARQQHLGLAQSFAGFGLANQFVDVDEWGFGFAIPHHSLGHDRCACGLCLLRLALCACGLAAFQQGHSLDAITGAFAAGVVV